MTLNIVPASQTLRTDLFPTRDRESTRGVLVRYSNTVNDERIDASALDSFDADRGYFGCVSHFVIRTFGLIERGRGPRTISSVPTLGDAPDHIVVTVVGGLSEDAEFEATDTEEQEDALELLLQAIADALNTPLEITDLRSYIRNRAFAEYLDVSGEFEDPEGDEAQ